MERIVVDKAVIVQVYSELKSKFLSLRKINDVIGADFRAYLYKGCSIPFEIFHKLEVLYGNPIPHGVKYIVDDVNLEKNEITAELVGIILGDGNISKIDRNKQNLESCYQLRIFTHSDDTAIINHTIDILKKAFRKTPSFRKMPRSKCVILTISGKKCVTELLSLGLKAGSKKKNQVGVPEWIRKNKDYSIACLRGLIDTDGSIYINNNRNECQYIIISFKNTSIPLLLDFKVMSENLGFTVSKAGKNAVQIARKSEIGRFISLVRPIKSNKPHIIEKLQSYQ